MSKNADKLFMNLLGIAKSIGPVNDAHLYGNEFISIEGKDHAGHKFTLSLTIKEEEKTDGN